MFKKIFKEAGRFFKRLLDDPLKLIITVAGAILTVMSFGTLAPAYAAAMGMSTVAMQVTIGATLAAVGIGFEQDWLLMALAVVGMAVSIYQIAFNNFGIVKFAGMFKSTGMLSALNMSQDTLQMLYELGIASRAMLIGVNIAIVAGLNRALEDDVSVVQGVSSVVSDIAADVVEGGSSVIGGILEGLGTGVGSVVGALAQSPVFWVALGGYLLYKGTGKPVTRISIGDEVLHGKEKGPIITA